MSNSIIGGLASLLAGVALAGATVFGLVSSQTGTPENSPANAERPVIDYGSTQ